MLFSGFLRFEGNFVNSRNNRDIAPLRTAVFWFWCLVRFAGFLQFSLRFLVFANNNEVFFLLFCLMHLKLFSGFAKKVTPCSHAKTLIPRDHLQLKDCITSSVSLAAIIWVIMAAKLPI